MSYMRSWASLVNSWTATAMCSYDALPGFRDELLPVGMKRRDVRAMRNPSVWTVRATLTGIIGPSEKPRWHSPAPGRERTINADLCSRKGQWRVLDMLFLGMFFSGKRMPVRSKQQPALVGACHWLTLGIARRSAGPFSSAMSSARPTCG